MGDFVERIDLGSCETWMNLVSEPSQLVMFEMGQLAVLDVWVYKPVSSETGSICEDAWFSKTDGLLG